MKKAVRLIITCLDCGEFFSLSVTDELQDRRDYVCLNCGEALDSSSIIDALRNANYYNNMVDWFNDLKDMGIELDFDNYYR